MKEGKTLKDVSSLKLLISGIILIVCSVIPFVILPMMAFPSEYWLERVVYFFMILSWRSYPFSIQTMVGWCYLFSMIFSVATLAVGILLLIKKARPLLDKKIPLIVYGAILITFLFFSVIVNIIQIAQEGLSPTFMFIFYILTQLVEITTFVFIVTTTKKKKQIVTKLEANQEE